MFVVASDLSEAQRERLLQGMDVTAYTFDAVRKVFVKLFCTPKSSMAAARAEPSSSKIMLKMKLDSVPLTNYQVSKVTLK